jgi:hypothetical protein
MRFAPSQRCRREAVDVSGSTQVPPQSICPTCGNKGTYHKDHLPDDICDFCRVQAKLAQLSDGDRAALRTAPDIAKIVEMVGCSGRDALRAQYLLLAEFEDDTGADASE